MLFIVAAAVFPALNWSGLSCSWCRGIFLHTQLVLDSQKRVFSWGFGGYGRLGHAEQKDEMVPRLVKLFDFPGRGAAQIYAGYTCSFAVSETGRDLGGLKQNPSLFGAVWGCRSLTGNVGALQAACFFGVPPTPPGSPPCTPKLCRTSAAGKSAA